MADEDLVKICDLAHYAMSGGNSQPWEFIIIKDRDTIDALRRVYEEEDYRFTYWLEQQRDAKYRHPSFNFPAEELEERAHSSTAQLDAPAVIAIVYDPRKQFGSVLSARANLADGSVSVLSCTMGHVSMLLHLAAASLGLSSSRCDTNSQDGYRKVLGLPEPLRLYCMVPIGYRAYEPGAPRRLDTESLIHYEKYDMSRYKSGEQILEHLEQIHAQRR